MSSANGRLQRVLSIAWEEVPTPQMTGPSHEREQSGCDAPTATLVSSGPPGALATAKTTSATATDSLLSGEDAMRREEMGRISVFARLTLLLCVLGIALAPVYGGDPVARRWMIGALATAMVTSTFIEWMTRDPARYRRGVLVAIVQVQEVCATIAAYFFGVFSPFPAVVSLGIYVYSLGASFGNALACYLNLALGQATLAALIMSGTLIDRGMVHAQYLSPTSQVLVQRGRGPGSHAARKRDAVASRCRRARATRSGGTRGCARTRHRPSGRQASEPVPHGRPRQGRLEAARLRHLEALER
jgi:hypothetical protein